MALDIYVDPLSGGYVALDNKLTYVDVTVNKINVLLNMKIGSYIYAPSSGNPLLNKTGPFSISEVSQDITTCLHPLIQNQEITNVLIISVIPNKILTNKYTIQMAVTLPNGNEPLITWEI